jgi:hypothetical protein
MNTAAELGVTQLYHSTNLIQEATANLCKGITMTHFAQFAASAVSTTMTMSFCMMTTAAFNHRRAGLDRKRVNQRE